MIARGLLACGLALIAIAAHAQPQTVRFYGYAYDLKSNAYLYTEVHEQQVDGKRWLGGRIRYYTPDARLMGDKTLSFASDPHVPVYRLDVPADGYYEGITAVGSEIVMQKRSRRDAPLQERRIGRIADLCGDSGFHSCLRDRFADLLGGAPYNFVLAVAGNLDSYRFRARRIADTMFEGRSAVRFRVEPDSMLRFFVDPLEVTYDPAQRQLLEYRGLSNIPDPHSGKPYLARIAYYSQTPKDVPKLPPLEP